MSRYLARSHKNEKTIPRLMAWAVVPLLLLLVPFIAMQVTEHVQWNAADFAFAGLLLAAAGSVYALLTSKRKTAAHRRMIGLAILIIFVMIWAQIAVGIFS